MKVLLPKHIGYGRLDALLAIFAHIRANRATVKKGQLLQLDWQRVERVSPAGYAILACLFDTAFEHQYILVNKGMSKQLKTIPVIQNLGGLKDFKRFPKPSLHNQQLEESILCGNESLLNLSFIEDFERRFGSYLSEDLAFSCRLILNELMQNSVDHSSAERYYLYAGVWRTNGAKEVHIGVLDMGVTIPAKLQQKYISKDDSDYLELALREGITTRRARPGGLGLFHTFEHLKNHEGTLTLISREAQLIRYFKSKKIRRQVLKNSLSGTWCLARFPAVRKKA